jgi:ribose transport system permease protein
MPVAVHTANTASRQHESWTAKLRHRLPLETWVAACTVLLWLLLAFGSPYFLAGGNIYNIMRQVSTDTIIAYGEPFAIILAGIDLSVGAVAGLTRALFVMMLADGMNTGVAVLWALPLGLCIGLVNGLAIDRLGIPPFIVTLAGLKGFRGLTLLVSSGMAIAGMLDALGLVASASILGIPTMFVVMLLFGVGSQFPVHSKRPADATG